MACRAAVGKKQTFAHAVVVEHGGAEDMPIVFSSLWHQPLDDFDKFFQLMLERNAPRLDLPRDFMQHARVGGQVSRPKFGQLFDQIVVVGRTLSPRGNVSRRPACSETRWTTDKNLD